MTKAVLNADAWEEVRGEDRERRRQSLRKQNQIDDSTQIINLSETALFSNPRTHCRLSTPSLLTPHAIVTAWDDSKQLHSLFAGWLSFGPSRLLLPSGVTSWVLDLSETSEVAQSWPTLCDPMDCSLPGSSIHGIFQARVLEWVAICFSRAPSQPRDWTRVSHIAGWANREAIIKDRP